MPNWLQTTLIITACIGGLGVAYYLTRIKPRMETAKIEADRYGNVWSAGETAARAYSIYTTYGASETVRK